MAIIDNYSKEELEQIVKQSKSLKEVIDKLGYTTHSGSNNSTVKKRLEQYAINLSHFTHSNPIKRNEENVFMENSTASQQTLRRWYLKGEYTPYICSICGQKPLWQGKELTLILDHIDGQNHNNQLHNLRWVCPNCNQQLETTGYKRMRTESIQKIEKKYYCIDCGKEITCNSNRCIECQAKSRRVTDWPTREELKQKIRYQSFVSLGKEYGVSDKAISKWCVAYNLPSRKKDINNYTNEEWELL